MAKPTGKAATVDIEEVAPVELSEEVLVAEHEGRRVQSSETIKSEDGEVLTTHTRPGTLIMYKPTENQGYVPKTVSGSAVRMLLRQGWKERCPDCDGQHLDKNGVASSDPNLCSAREPVAVRVCRVCNKRIYDNRRFHSAEVAGEDPNVIEDDDYEKTTGADRTRASLNVHYWVRHPREAQMMGLPPLPVAMRSMVEKPETA